MQKKCPTNINGFTLVHMLHPCCGYRYVQDIWSEEDITICPEISFPESLRVACLIYSPLKYLHKFLLYIQIDIVLCTITYNEKQ